MSACHTLDQQPAQRLVVAYAFAPYADTSAVAATKRVAVEGVPVDVISNRMDALRERDETLTELVQGLVRRHVQVPTSTLFAGWSSIRSFTRAAQGRLQEWEGQPGGAPYTSMFSRAHFVASHFLAATLAGGRSGLHWRAEMSDPLSRRATGELRTGPTPSGDLADELAMLLRHRGVRMSQEATVYEWAETLAYLLADEVIFTSTGQRDYCLSLVDDPVVLRSLEAAALVVPHATLPEKWYTRRPAPVQLEHGPVHVGYFGSFYASQDPRGLLAAVSEMAAKDRTRLRLHLFTGQSEELRTHISQLAVADVVLVHDRLPFLEFLAATRQMDVLLAVDASPVKGAAAPHVRLSKWSDYVGSGTNVWGVVTPGSDLASQDLAYRTPLHHLTATLQMLTRLARSAR